MRISPWPIWLGLAWVVGAAPEENVTFTTDKFTGQNGTAILSYSSMLNSGDAGYMFEWQPSRADGGPTVASLVLADLDGEAIVTMEANATNTNLEGIFGVDWLRGSVTLYKGFLENNLASYINSTAFFFQLEWSYDQAGAKNKRATGPTYSYSPLWAAAATNEIAQDLLVSYTALSSPADAYESQGASPAVQPYASGTSASPASEPSAPTSSSSPTSAAKSQASGGKGLSTGALAGIVVGAVVALLVLVSLGAGCLCLRNRRRRGGAGGGSGGGGDAHHAIKDLMADKEARAIMETTPDTPYSERDDSQHAMHLQHHPPLSPSRLGESAVDMSAVGDVGSHHRGSGIVGAAVTATRSGAGGGSARDGDSPTNTNHHLHNDHDHDSDDNISELEHASMMGSSAVLRLSSQQERSFTPYTDRSPTDYSHHHRVVDGADLVQQEQSNSNRSSSNNKRRPSNRHNSVSPVVRASTEEEQQQHQKQRPPPLSPGLNNPDTTTTTTTNNNNNSAHSSPDLRPARFARARSTTPSGISGRYAHLVEDGMTDDEIRRLEEEERALDEAIEQATTTTTTATATATATPPGRV